MSKTKRAVLGTILALMNALGAAFVGGSWDAWRVVLKAIFALPMTADELALFRALSGRAQPPGTQPPEVWMIVGRRGGKSIIAALIAVFCTTCRTYRLAPGERGVFSCIAADRKQARVLKGYIAGLLRLIGALEELIETETAEQITLTNGLVIEIVTSNFRTLRGRTCIGAICDEVAFWMSDYSANPDTEILAALRPAMATIENALLVCITSPYARRGEAWKAFHRWFGKDGAPVLVIRAESLTMDPSLPQSVVDQAYAEDPARAAAEYGAEFRTDVETFIAREVVEANVVSGRHELEPRPGVKYIAFVDPSGGSSDSMTLAIAHEQKTRLIVDALREVTAPFDPDSAVAEFATVLRSYRITEVRGDKYGGSGPRQDSGRTTSRTDRQRRQRASCTRRCCRASMRIAWNSLIIRGSYRSSVRSNAERRAGVGIPSTIRPRVTTTSSTRVRVRWCRRCDAQRAAPGFPAARR